MVTLECDKFINWSATLFVNSIFNIQKVLKFAIFRPVAQVSGNNAVLEEKQVVPRG